MKKIIFAFAGLVVVAGFFLLAFFLSPQKQPASNGSPSGQATDLPVSPTVAQPGLTTVSSSTSSSNTLLTLTNVTGGPIQTSNFLADSSTVKDANNPGYYYIGYHVLMGSSSDAMATTSPPYTINYISATQYFNIAILQEPIGPVRTEAEQYLMAHLGISESQMCQLSYMVSVPDKVNSQFAGKNLGFSFCLGATVLPQ